MKVENAKQPVPPPKKEKEKEKEQGEKPMEEAPMKKSTITAYDELSSNQPSNTVQTESEYNHRASDPFSSFGGDNDDPYA
mmetsp:Transcript_15212/g.14787  ORF Transcript_15212/g.14787 Transcript_15212/m.14787 type:complete len:80 (+) Transcript_15212:923-1162(+)